MSTNMQSSSDNVITTTRFDNILKIISQIKEKCDLKLQEIATELAAQMKEVIANKRQDLDASFLKFEFQKNSLCRKLRDCKYAIKQIINDLESLEILIQDIETTTITDYSFSKENIESCPKNIEIYKKSRDIFDMLHKLMNVCTTEVQETTVQIAARMNHLIDKYAYDIDNNFLQNTFKSDTECIKLTNEKYLLALIHKNCEFITTYFEPDDKEPTNKRYNKINK